MSCAVAIAPMFSWSSAAQHSSAGCWRVIPDRNNFMLDPFVIGVEALYGHETDRGGDWPIPTGVESNGLWLRDPDGNLIEIAVTPKTSPKEKSAIGHQSAGPGERGAPSRSAVARTHPRRLAHVLMFTRDVMKAIVIGSDDKLAVRLALAGRKLGEEFVVGDASRGRQTRLLEDSRANLLGGRRGTRQAAPVLRHIEIGLVERQRLDQRRVLNKNSMDLARNGAIDVEARRHEHQFRALTHRRGRRHGRTHAEGAGLVTRRGHDPPLGAVSNRDGAPSKRRVVALFNRRIERVHVDVNDLAHRHRATISDGEQKENSGVG